jgi:uncharacterized protein (DUF1330 family)
VREVGLVQLPAVKGAQGAAHGQRSVRWPGDWSGDKVIVLAFPDRATFTTWLTSPEYREISKDRIAATEGVVLLVRGLSP